MDDNSDDNNNNNSDLCLLSADKFTASCNDLKRAGIAMNRDGLTADDCAQVQAYNGCRKELLARENAIRQCRPFIAAKIRQMDENIDKFCAPVLLAAASASAADANSAISSRVLLLGKGNYAVLLLITFLACLLNIGGVSLPSTTKTAEERGGRTARSNNFFACQQRQNKAITECSASSFGGLDTASKQLTSGECCNLSRYTHCVLDRAVTGDCKESLSSLKEQMMGALKQNCPKLACSGASALHFTSISLLFLTTASLAFHTFFLS
ncbi:hypothetical protein TYRP_005426 [Tyrophagus putrescentiae]|nr:hypothetical protein TYRP_005426 [Tyrophagus putrescentiae]